MYLHINMHTYLHLHSKMHTYMHHIVSIPGHTARWCPMSRHFLTRWILKVLGLALISWCPMLLCKYLRSYAIIYMHTFMNIIHSIHVWHFVYMYVLYICIYKIHIHIYMHAYMYATEPLYYRIEFYIDTVFQYIYIYIYNRPYLFGIDVFPFQFSSIEQSSSAIRDLPF